MPVSGIVAESATIGVTMRAYSTATLARMRDTVERIVRSACSSMVR